MTSLSRVPDGERDVWTAIDLACADDDDAKRRAATLSSGHHVELWLGDRRVTLLRLRRKVLAGTFSAGEDR